MIKKSCNYNGCIYYVKEIVKWVFFIGGSGNVNQEPGKTNNSQSDFKFGFIR